MQKKKKLEYAGELHIIALRRRELQEPFLWPKLAFCSFGVNKSISTILEYPCQLRVMISGYLILLHLLFLGSKIDMHEKFNPCFFLAATVDSIFTVHFNTLAQNILFWH
jgi:hypothetical protein